MSNNSGKTYNRSPGRPANTENWLQSFFNNNRRNFVSNVILGYEEHVSEEYLEFIVKLIRHYTRHDSGEQFLTNLEQKYREFISKLEAGIRIEKDKVLLLKIFKSTTFKAIIFSFINFFSHKNFTKIEEALNYFFESLLSIFRLDYWMKKLIYAQEGHIMNKISILMIINKYVILSWNNTFGNTFNNGKSKLDEDRIFAIFQETMFATSLEVILGKSANTFVCNLPGCGDCVTIFKNLKKVFLFTECKKQGSRAKTAIIELHNAQGINKSTTNKSLQRDLIYKVDRDIQSRFFSSFLANYCEDKAKILLTFGILEIPNISKPPYQEDFRKIFFNMVIPLDILRDLDNLLVYDVKNKKETFNLIKHLKSLNLESDKNCSGVANLPSFNFGNRSLSMSSNSVEKWITTQETAKFLTEFNISNKNELVELRQTRRLPKEAAVVLKNNNLDNWPVGWVRKFNELTRTIWYHNLNTANYIPERNATSAWVPWEGILRARIDLDQHRKNRKLFKTLIKEFPKDWETIENVKLSRSGNVDTCYLHLPSSILLSKQEFDSLKEKIDSRLVNLAANLSRLNVKSMKNKVNKVVKVRNDTGNRKAANGARTQGSNAANENPRSRRLKKFYDSMNKLTLEERRKELYKNLRKEGILTQNIPLNRLEAFLNRAPERWNDEDIKVVYRKYTDPEYNKRKAEENQYYLDVAMGRYEYGKNPITHPPQFKYNLNKN